MDAPTASGDIRSRLARTGAPAWASTAFTPSVRSSVLLPDMFEPLTTNTRGPAGASPPMRTSLRTTRASSMSGWPMASASSKATAGPTDESVCPTNSGKGSWGCSKAWLASEHSASISPVAVSHGRTTGPECRRHASTAKAMCAVHSTNGSAIRTSK